jgi:hypothetical protein
MLPSDIPTMEIVRKPQQAVDIIARVSRPIGCTRKPDIKRPIKAEPLRMTSYSVSAS